jgi:hypothetical protein
LSAVCAFAQDRTANSEHGSERERQQMRRLSRPERVLLPEEMRGNCAGLTVTTKAHIDRLREFESKARKEAAGPTSSLFGGSSAARDVARERERVAALNVVLDAKGCKLVNVEEELRKAPEARPQSDTPQPKSDQQKGARKRGLW